MIYQDNVIDAQEDCDSESPFFRPEEFEENLSRLFELEAELLNDAIYAAVYDVDPDIIDQGMANLSENTHEIANLFATVYGSPFGTRIDSLLIHQNNLFLAYIDAVKLQEDAYAKELLRQAYANGHMLVEFLNIMNPYVAKQPEKYMLDEHVTLETDQIKAYVLGDIERVQDLRRHSVAQFKEFALHIVKAITMQMTESCHPANFSEYPVCDYDEEIEYNAQEEE